ncbi:MAG: hypothetical protein ABL901_13950 [Hyphomicrobiaceae bacterium]
MRVLGFGAVAGGIVAVGVLVATGSALVAQEKPLVQEKLLVQEKTGRGQNLMKVDWADPEIAAFRASGAANDPAAAGLNLKLPILAFGELPQVVKNVAGPDAKPIKPRSIVSDPAQPFWYHLVDTYEGINIAINADRRINVEGDAKFRIGAANVGAEATLGTKAKPRISIFDASKEEGMEGLVIEYTVQRFGDIPYTVTIECSTKAKTQCKDLAVIAKDEALLKIVALGEWKKRQ